MTKFEEAFDIFKGTLKKACILKGILDILIEQGRRGRIFLYLDSICLYLLSSFPKNRVMGLIGYHAGRKIHDRPFFDYFLTSFSEK